MFSKLCFHHNFALVFKAVLTEMTSLWSCVQAEVRRVMTHILTLCLAISCGSTARAQAAA